MPVGPVLQGTRKEIHLPKKSERVNPPTEILLMLQGRNVTIGGKLDDSIKQWTAKRKSALAIEIIQGKTIVGEASRSCDFEPFETET
jgi:hypothetical protein